VCIILYARNRNYLVTVSFTSHSRIAGPECGTFLLSPF